MKNNISYIITTFLLLLYSILLAYLSSFSTVDNLFDSIIIKSLILIFLIQFLVFIPSFIFKTEHYFDLTGGISFILVIFYALYDQINILGFIDFRSLILSIFIIVWSSRLSLFLFFRVKKSGDIRFVEIKKSFLKFLRAWVFQGWWVFTCTLPVLIVLSNKPLNSDYLLYLGIILWIFGFLFEIVADKQKSNFNKLNKGKFISSGLWSISRHPNYFGELTLWLGITIGSLSSFSGFQFIAFLSPITIYLLLNYVSGVNLLEDLAEKRWGKDPKYIKYKNDTPVIFPKIF
jgi:steroid 5-alpha reductase family enzyme|tara:strand:+ start:18443 stop:19309 length:867 start_codon:yes stop_codon:yes gene_type:complete